MICGIRNNSHINITVLLLQNKNKNNICTFGVEKIYLKYCILNVGILTSDLQQLLKPQHGERSPSV